MAAVEAPNPQKEHGLWVKLRKLRSEPGDRSPLWLPEALEVCKSRHAEVHLLAFVAGSWAHCLHEAVMA